MSEQTNAGRPQPAILEVVPALGFVLSGIAAAGLLVATRRGEGGIVVLVGLLASLVTVAAFFARRHGALERDRSAPIAAAGSLLVVLTAGYGLTQGVHTSVSASLGSLSIGGSLVATAFLAGGGSLALAVADRGGLTGGDLLERTGAVVTMSLLALGAFFVAVPWQVLLAVPTMVLVGDLTDVAENIVSQTALALAMGTVAIAYVHLTDRGWSFFDLSVPDRRSLGWIVGGLGLVFGLLMAVSGAFSATGVETATHSSIDAGQENADLLLVGAAVSILFTGPFEEVLYRNAIQKSLYRSFSRPGAIVVTSVIFAAVHYSAFAAAGAPLGGTLASLAVVFVLSCGLGAIYERTENLLVPAVVHGLYNAFVFLNNYPLSV